MTPLPRRDPWRQFQFILELDGKPIAGFSEVSGLAAETDVVDDREGAEKTRVTRKLPGLHKVASITLQRGVANRGEFYKWQAGGSASRRAATIVLRDATGNPVTRWHVENAWISKIVGPSLNATGNDIAIETLELAHEGLSPEE